MNLDWPLTRLFQRYKSTLWFQINTSLPLFRKFLLILRLLIIYLPSYTKNSAKCKTFQTRDDNTQKSFSLGHLFLGLGLKYFLYPILDAIKKMMSTKVLTKIWEHSQLWQKYKMVCILNAFTSSTLNIMHSYKHVGNFNKRNIHCFKLFKIWCLFEKVTK